MAHLAQFNIGLALYPLDDPRMADFMDALDEINGLAERSEGFVWRLVNDEGNATTFRPFPDDTIVNFSVWESVDLLREFTYKTEHVEYLRRRGEWFQRHEDPHLVMWYVDEGYTPTLEEAVERLGRLRDHGPGPDHFTFRTIPAPPPTADRPHMPGYGVPDTLDGVLDWSWAEERLRRRGNYWLTTVSSDGQPHAMPLWGAWSSHEQVFAFSCSPTSLKARNLASNPQVVVAVDDTVEVVSLEGRAELVTKEDELARYGRIIGEHYRDTPDEIDELAGFMAAGTLYVVRPDKAFGMIETPEDFGPKATRWTWARSGGSD